MKNSLLKTAAVGVLSLGLLASPTQAQNVNGNGQQVAGTRPPATMPASGQPWEQRAPYGKGQKPAVVGQTRTGAVLTKTPFTEKVVASGLKHPWALAFMPDGRMLVTEKVGMLRIVTQDGLVGDTLKGLPPRIAYRPEQSDAGLLDVAVDPQFTTNRMLYLTYVERKRNGGTGLVVASAKLATDEFHLENVKKIYQVRDSTSNGYAHYGSRLLFDKEGKLLVSISERMFEPTRLKTQQLSSQLGKIVRINTDGTPAARNPRFHPDSTRALPELWAVGFRNPQGLAWHPVTGDLWEDEHGTQGGDEVNLVRPGHNYGWPVIAYGVEYDWKPIEGGITQKKGLEQPVYYWDPTVAPAAAPSIPARPCRSGKTICSWPAWRASTWCAWSSRTTKWWAKSACCSTSTSASATCRWAGWQPLGGDRR
ncbi:PQQ-dependent sugar dehydrogenase [Hymenobacter volaticus]|uniref:PQQ-dependent sugar dehydrogenase n=1 Tax=Hymenobacter volaticus TaxID=2932254 RepID=A0ABY4GG37_9BACT|nr:PQQ-dependent sugar dehydrogenase [Hymenobacter volaticus]UOQ69942.1 PQQ-dependent sugar dehydrogenase [Hymenobacter volaticus]